MWNIFMIKINNKQYDNYDIKVTWGEFNTSDGGKKRFGIAPYITFHIDNIIKIIGLEFTFSKEMFLDTKINKKTNVKDFINIMFYNENEKEWDTPIIENYNCFITRKDEKVFNLDFRIEESKINILINVDIDLL